VLPNEDHVARVCPPSTCSGGQPTLASFAPHPGSNDRPADDALSVHWLERLLVDDSVGQKLVALRQFLLVDSPHPELKPRVNGRIAVIPVIRLQTQSVPELGVSFECNHEPRGAPPLPHDPHSVILTNPAIAAWPKDDEPFRMTVQQFICDQIVHVEAGRI